MAAGGEREGAEVVVVGSANVDLVFSTPRIPGVGETVVGSGFQQLWGGKGCNQAVAAARLGARTAMVGCVGSDAYGESYLRQLAAEGVETSGLGQAPGTTGLACVQVGAAGENNIVVVPGANAHVSLPYVDACRDIIEGATVVLVQNEIPPPATLAALGLARSRSITTVYNPAPAPDPPSSADALLPLSSVVVPNEHELSLLTSRPVTDAESAADAARELISRGAGCVVVTLGARGALLVRGGSPPPPPRLFPARPVDAVDTTGAGDALAGSLAAHLARAGGLDGAAGERALEEAVAAAVAVASLSVTKPGAQGSYPTGDEVPEAARLPPPPSATAV